VSWKRERSSWAPSSTGQEEEQQQKDGKKNVADTSDTLQLIDQMSTGGRN